jgi:uncharacterized protein
MGTVIHHPELNCFVLDANGAEATLKYRLFNNGQGVTTIDFNSTFVPPEFRGKGLAEKLVRAGLKWAKEQDYVLTASCWYVAKFIK